MNSVILPWELCASSGISIVLERETEIDPRHRYTVNNYVISRTSNVATIENTPSLNAVE